MQYKLRVLANTFSGYGFRGAIKPDWKGGCVVLQAKDITANENFSHIANLTPINYSTNLQNYLLRQGDVLLVSRAVGRGSFKSSVFIAENENVIASSLLLVIRIINKMILPEYLSLYLNSSEGQNKLMETVSGSYVKAISRIKLENLTIPTPSIESQKIFVQLSQNIKRQQKIKDKQIQLKQEIINALFTQIINH